MSTFTTTKDNCGRDMVVGGGHFQNPEGGTYYYISVHPPEDEDDFTSPKRVLSLEWQSQSQLSKKDTPTDARPPTPMSLVQNVPVMFPVRESGVVRRKINS